MSDPLGLTQIGRITSAHGIRGEVKVFLTSEDTSLFAGLEEVWLMDREKPVRYQVDQVRPQKGQWILKIQGIEDRNQAEELKNLGLWVPDEWLKPLEEGEFFIHELIGAQVFDRAGNLLGQIEHYFEPGPHVVFEVKSEAGDFLFPATDEGLKEILPEQKRVIIEPLPGLLELNRNQESS